MNEVATTRTFNGRLARWLFAVYALVYLAFVLVNGFAPNWVDWKPAGGVNLAIWWGFGLIGLAFLEAMIYGFFCRAEKGGDESFETPPRTSPQRSDQRDASEGESTA